MVDVREQRLRAFIDRQKEVALTLLPNVHQPQNVKSGVRVTLVHWAAMHRWHDTCQILVENYYLNPTD